MPTSEKPLSTSAHAILGLLSLRPWTTYELAQQVQRSLSWFWPRAERRLYDEPKVLAARGLAEARVGYTGQRRRTVYEITDAGRDALREWLSQPTSARSVEFEAMLKIFFADAGSRDQLLEVLAGIEHEAADRLRTLRAQMQGALTAGSAFPRRWHLQALGLQAYVEQETVMLRWARWARAAVEGWPSSTDAGEWDARAVVRDLVAEVDRRLQE